MPDAISDEFSDFLGGFRKYDRIGQHGREMSLALSMLAPHGVTRFATGADQALQSRHNTSRQRFALSSHGGIRHVQNSRLARIPIRWREP